MPLVIDGSEPAVGDDHEERNRNAAGMKNAAQPFGCGKIGGRVDDDEVGSWRGNEGCGRGDDYLHRVTEQTQGG
ncbi:hypothetical protein GCM10007394_09680 [Salinibacterium amurskyense]|nr:hypothetical protein GCM10007394_09680 [Salinibacterium amurskyense]